MILKITYQETILLAIMLVKFGFQLRKRFDRKKRKKSVDQTLKFFIDKAKKSPEFTCTPVKEPWQNTPRLYYMPQRMDCFFSINNRTMHYRAFNFFTNARMVSSSCCIAHDITHTPAAPASIACNAFSGEIPPIAYTGISASLQIS